MGQSPAKTATDEAAPPGKPGAPVIRRPSGRWRILAAMAGTVVVPGLLWAAIPFVPLLPLTTGGKLWASGGLAVAAEAVFWVSALLLGREVARRYRRVLDPRRWLRGKRGA